MRTNPTIPALADYTEQNPVLSDLIGVDITDGRNEEEEIESFPETEEDLFSHPFNTEFRNYIQHIPVDTEQAINREYWTRLNVPIDYTQVERNVIADIQLIHGVNYGVDIETERRRAIEQNFNRTRNNWSMRYTDLEGTPRMHNHWMNNSFHINWEKSRPIEKPDPEVDMRIKVWQEEYIKEKGTKGLVSVAPDQILNWLAKNFIMTRIK